MNNLRRSLSSAQADHQAALQQIAVAEAQQQQALQDSQEQVSHYNRKEHNYNMFNVPALISLGKRRCY